MFDRSYFAARYFAGRYFQHGDVTILVLSYAGAYAYVVLYKPSGPLVEYGELDNIVFSPIAYSDIDERNRESVIQPTQRNTDISGGVAGSTIERVL